MIIRPLTTIELQRAIDAELNPNSLHRWVKSPTFPNTEFCWVYGPEDTASRTVVYKHNENMIAIETTNDATVIDSETFRHIENILNIFDRAPNLAIQEQPSHG